MLRSKALPLVAKHVARPKWYATAATASSSSPIVPAVPQKGVSHWKTTDPVRLSRDNFIDLLYGKTPLIKEPNFLTPTECWEYEKTLSPLLQPYKHNTGPILRKVGLAQV